MKQRAFKRGCCGSDLLIYTLFLLVRLLSASIGFDVEMTKVIPVIERVIPFSKIALGLKRLGSKCNVTYICYFHQF